MDGLRVYFDFTLSSLLLYNMERDQHERAMQEAGLRETRLKNEAKLKEQECNNSLSVEKSGKKSVSNSEETKEESGIKQSEVTSEVTVENYTDESKQGE